MALPIPRRREGTSTLSSKKALSVLSSSSVHKVALAIIRSPS